MRRTSHSHRIAAALVLAAAAAIVPAGPAAAGGAPVTQIRLGRSIGPVKLGMQRSVVRTIDGAESQLAPVTGKFPARRYRYADLRQVVWFPTAAPSARAIFAITTASIYRTGRGIGVGSSRAALRAAHPAARCATARLCVIGQELPGRRVTVFRLRGGAVVSVAVGFVRD